MLRIKLQDIFGSEKIEKIHQNESYQKSVTNSLQDNNNKLHLSSTFFTIQQSKSIALLNDSMINTQRKPKMPGERLYYQAISKKYSQIQTIQKNYLDDQLLPKQESKMNKHSKQILKRKGNNNSLIQKKTKRTQALTTEQMKEAAQLAKCTFHPHLISKQKNKQQRLSQQIFMTLYENQKIKKLKQDFEKRQLQIKQKSDKKMNKQQLEAFLKKNEQFISKKTKKADFLRNYLKNHDFHSGQRYFEPKINPNIKRHWENPEKNYSYLKTDENFKKSHSQQSFKLPMNKIQKIKIIKQNSYETFKTELNEIESVQSEDYQHSE